ncbi:MAG: hypothetical protein FWF95_01565 [Syntrophorhabdaceae bacterium]|nr:hypothetical protein [Syntrophorhabdaceae bacterium]
MTNGDPQVELLATIKQGVDTAISVADEIEAGILDCSKQLRVDPSFETFTSLSTGISNLGDIVALMQEIQNGCAHLRNNPVPAESVAVFGKSVDLFREAQASMERQDWISLADLMQYEISPILKESKRELIAMRDCLEQN